jgi:uncharacterized protein (UPF0333 family)
MKSTYKKGQAATEFLMTYGWAILAIVIVAAVLWNMGIFKGSCTSTAAVQVFPAGSQLAVADWTIKDLAGNINMTVNNLAGNQVTITSATYTIGSSTSTIGGTPIPISAGSRGILDGVGGTVTGVSSGDCFDGGSVSVTYTISGGVPHTITGNVHGKYP